MEEIGCRTVFAALVSLAAGAAAQSVNDKLEVSRQAVESQRRILVSGALPLTDAEADAFWPLYDAYEEERRPFDERANKLVADFLVGAATLTDAQAKAMVEQALDLEEVACASPLEEPGHLARRRHSTGPLPREVDAARLGTGSDSHGGRAQVQLRAGHGIPGAAVEGHSGPGPDVPVRIPAFPAPRESP